MRLLQRTRGSRRCSGRSLPWFALVVMLTSASLCSGAEDPKPSDQPGWSISPPTLKDHTSKSYSAGKFILYPAKEHRFVIAKLDLQALQADPKAVDVLATAQKLSDADKRALASKATENQRCFEMSKLWLVDADGKQYPALWNIDDTITTDVTTTAGTLTTPGRDPANWTGTRRRAVKLSKEAKEKLVKDKTIDATHPDFRTSFSGLLETGEAVPVSFVFQLPDGVSRDQIRIKYSGEAPVSLDGQVAGTGSRKPEGTGSTPSGTARPASAEPNWQVEDITLQSLDAASFTRDKVTINPVAGNTLVQVSLRLTALRPDAKAVDVYSRMWSNIDRRAIQMRADGGMRVIESRNLALVDARGARYVSLWNPDVGIRTHVYTAEVTPNSTSTSRVSHWNGKPSETWVDAEQSFITRTVRPANQQPLVEHVTLFSGLLRLQRPVDLTFLFSIPTDTDRQTLKLVLDSESFAIGARATTSP